MTSHVSSQSVFASKADKKAAEDGRFALSKSTGMSLAEVEWMEKTYITHSGLPRHANLYLPSVKDYFTPGNKKCIPKHKNHWTEKGLHKCLNVHSQIAAAMFKLMDTDNNGTLDFDELVAGYAMITKGSNVERVKLLFKIFDLDGSGYLDKAETLVMCRVCMKAFHETAISSHSPRGTGIAQQKYLFEAKKYAENQSPEVINAHFENKAVLTTHRCFDICDKDKDGKITLDEFLHIVDGECPEITDVLALFKGGGISMWNCLGKYIDENGAAPTESDTAAANLPQPLSAKMSAPEINDDGTPGKEKRNVVASMSPGCAQQ